VTAQQRPGTTLRCAVTSGVEAGNGVADEEAERLGGASQIGRRRIRLYWSRAVERISLTDLEASGHRECSIS
jgi:hypothetical protein